MRNFRGSALSRLELKRGFSVLLILFTNVLTLNINAKSNLGIEDLVGLGENILSGKKFEARFNLGSERKIYELFGFASLDEYLKASDALDDRHASMLSRIGDLEASVALVNQNIPDGFEFNGVSKDTLLTQTNKKTNGVATSSSSSSPSTGTLILPPAASTAFLAQSPVALEFGETTALGVCENGACNEKQTLLNGIVGKYGNAGRTVATLNEESVAADIGLGTRVQNQNNIFKSSMVFNHGTPSVYPTRVAGYGGAGSILGNEQTLSQKPKQELDKQFGIENLDEFLNPSLGKVSTHSAVGGGGSFVNQASGAEKLDIATVESTMGILPEGWFSEKVNVDGVEVVVRGALDKKYDVGNEENPDNYYQIALSAPMGKLSPGIYTLKKTKPSAGVCNISTGTCNTEANFNELYDNFEARLKGTIIRPDDVKPQLPVVLEALTQLNTAVKSPQSTHNFVEISRNAYKSFKDGYLRNLSSGEKKAREMFGKIENRTKNYWQYYMSSPTFRHYKATLNKAWVPGLDEALGENASLADIKKYLNNSKEQDNFKELQTGF